MIAAATLHLTLIAAICARDTFTVLGEGATLLPKRWIALSRRSEVTLQSALAQNLSTYNPVRQGIGAYVNAAGVEAGYGFFAPNIPRANKISFELTHPDGRVTQELPTLHDNPTAFRLASLLDLIGRTKEEGVREGLIKYLVYAIWREHSDVSSIRAILGTIDFPRPDDFARGARQSYRASHVYDFTFEVEPKN